MANYSAVYYSIGFLEGWIEQNERDGVIGADQALQPLKILSDAYKEYRLSLNSTKDTIETVKRTLSGGA